MRRNRSVSKFGVDLQRAPPVWGTRGRGFESRHSDHSFSVPAETYKRSALERLLNFKVNVRRIAGVKPLQSPTLPPTAHSRGVLHSSWPTSLPAVTELFQANAVTDPQSPHLGAGGPSGSAGLGAGTCPGTSGHEPCGQSRVRVLAGDRHPPLTGRAIAGSDPYGGLRVWISAVGKEHTALDALGVQPSGSAGACFSAVLRTNGLIKILR